MKVFWLLKSSSTSILILLLITLLIFVSSSQSYAASAVISGADSGTVTEDDISNGGHLLVVSGKLNISDSDAGEDSFILEFLTGKYGQFVMLKEGSWYYQSGNGKAIIQNLSAGDKLTDRFTVSSLDGTTHNVVITILGVDDSESSAYLEEITLPFCDANNPAVQVIETNSDWLHINDKDKRIFCVSPGNYTSVGRIKLNSSGTAELPRYILLNDGKTRHPGKLSNVDSANVQLEFENASYWIVNRMSSRNITEARSYPIRFLGASRNNIINKHFINNCHQGIYILGGSHNNVIQNSRISNQTLNGRKNDGVGIALGVEKSTDTIAFIQNTKIIDNEIVNYNDGIQLVRSKLPDGTWRPTNYQGTIIDFNRINIKPNIYTDGNGSQDSFGYYAYAENAIDIKAGSDDVNKPVIVSNNHLWGYRTSDKTDSKTSGNGFALGFHYTVTNVDIENNYIFDSMIGMAGNTLINSNVKNNVFYKMKKYYTFFYDTDNVLFQNNILVSRDNVKDYWTSFDDTTKNTSIKDNVILGVFSNGGSRLRNESFVDKNYYYDVESLPRDESNPYVYPAISFAEHSDYTFTTNRYTNSPKEITLKNVKPTVNSPHISLFNNLQ